ncbi:MAG: hypothetical protein KatS3mg129_2967 [Leptospiraceae bacterium]|nr:MAG: hypothetical protein KatS3mg129_2967 [Leptospiraceae bacterium]
MKFKKKLLLGMGFILGLMAGSSLIADTAIYFCQETSAYGAAWGVPLARARQVAKQYCEQNGGTNCQELISCKTGFAAIVTDNEGTIGASCGARTQQEADKGAIESCQQYSENPSACTIKHQWRG